MTKLIDQLATGESPADPSTTAIHAECGKPLADHCGDCEECPRVPGPCWCAAPVTPFDAEIEAQLAGIDPATAAAIRSIARQLVAVHTAETRGYVSGYLAGVRERLGASTVEARKASAVAYVDSLHVGEQSPAVDPTAVERFMDASYTAMDAAYTAIEEWVTRASTPERTYVEAGHEAVTAIDDAIRALHQARAELIAERRRDEAERATRVDALLAESRAAREVDERDLKPVVDVAHEGYALGGRGAACAEVTE